MGVIIPQVVTEDRASGAQVIDGSLNINGESDLSYLTKTFSAGTQTTWTVSLWVKINNPDNQNHLFFAGPNGSNRVQISIEANGVLNAEFSTTGTTTGHKVTTRVLREPNSWYHIVIAVDTTIASPAGDRIKIYINGVRETSFTTSVDFAENYQTQWMGAQTHTIAKRNYSADYFEGKMSQMYNIDGQALGPENFGFTDPLTNTWRPKKYTVTTCSATSWDYKAYSGTGSPGSWSSMTSVSSSNSLGSNSSSGTSNASVAIFSAGAKTKTFKFTAGAGDSRTINVWTSDDGINWTSESSTTFSAIGGSGHQTTGQYAVYQFDNGDFFSSSSYAVTVNDVNSFYLPFDGSAPIHEDASGNGNDFTPVQMWGHVSLDKATGGKPILRTVSGGNWGAAPLTERKTYVVTVASDGGNKYFLDGVNYTSTTIPLLRGGTYKFDQSDSTNSGHPLRFATAADAAGSTQYTSGVSQAGTPGSAGAYTVITVPHDAPDTLYYYCTNHNGMGGATSNSTDETKTDLYASSLVLALPLVGVDDDVSNQINSGSTTKTFTANGNAAASNAQSNFYGGSYDFDGSGDYLEHTLSGSTFLLQGSVWTVECWVRLNASSDRVILNVGNGTASNSNFVWQLRYVSSKFQGALYNGTTQRLTNATNTSSLNDWHHVVYQRNGNTQTLYVNGILESTTSWTETPNNNSSCTLTVGGSFNGADAIDAQIQDVRVYNGVAKYTDDFLVGSTKPNITPETPSGISYRSEFEKITDGAVSFDGNRGGDSGDYLALESGSDLQFGSGDFTIEVYVFPNSISNYDPIIDNGSIAGNNQHDWRLYLGSVGEVWFDANVGGSDATRNGASAGVSYGVVARKWNHIAITRSGNTIYTFVDGIQKASTSFSGTINSNYTTAYIGADNMVNGTMYYFDGFISNVRVLKGTALYTSDFTPPREPLTAVTNTKLLCCQSSSDANRPTVSPASTVNDGTDFSTNQVTGSAGLTGIPKIFNGQIGNYKNPDSGAQVSASSDNHILWTPTTGIPYTSKVEVFCYAANGYNITNTYSVNGGAEVSFTGGGSNYNNNNWITVATGSGTINSIKIRLQRSGSVSNVQWCAVRIDGVVLVDNCTNTPIESYYDAVPTPFNANSTDVLGRISNYATLNPLDKSSQWTLSNGNLSATGGTQGGGDTFGQAASSKKLPTTGKYYIEMTKDGSGSDSNAFGVGVSRCNRGSTGSWPSSRQEPGYVGYLSFEYGFTVTHGLSTGNIQYKNNNANAAANGVTYTGAYSGSAGNAKPYAIAIDCDNLTMRFYENGVQIGPVQTFVHPGPDAVVTFFKSDFQLTVNFGQKPFAFPPPEGFGPLCDANLPRPTEAAVRPDKHFNTVLYNGTAVVGRSVTGVGFKPDLIWIKNRANGVANSWHSLTDSVRGERLFPNEDIAEDPSKDVLSFLDDGMTLNYGTYVNFNGGTYAAWCWKAGDDDEIITYTTKVVSDSGNKYRFDDFGTSAVTLELAEGQTYIFDQSDSSNSGHPIRFSTTSDGTHGGGSEYTTGVVTEGTPGSAGAKTTITVASGAPVLHYYCSAHSGMGGQANTNTTKGYSNFAGTIQSRISANTDAGFSIVTYSGNNSVTASVGHGLNSEPKFIIVKSRNNSKFWTTYHASVSKNTFKTFELNTSAVANDNPDNEFFGETQAINANVFTVGNPDSAASNSTNVTGNNYVAYCWAEIEGFSKFGTIKGNNSANGPYIDCGFKPAWIMFKNTDSSGYWAIFDSKRDTFNQCNKVIRANDDPDENTNLYFIDILSNGFKIRDSGGLNGTANTVYVAFAENPTMNLYGAQATAR